MSPEELQKVGYGSTDTKAPIRYTDPIEEERYRPEGEGHRGVPVHRHPRLTLNDHLELFELYIDLQDTDLGRTESPITDETITERSNAEVALTHVWRAAMARRQSREIKEMTRGQGR